MIIYRYLIGASLYKFIPVAYAAILVFIGFTWRSQDLFLVGGDDIKLEFFDPHSKFSSFILWSKYSLTGSESYVIHELSSLPFYGILYLIHSMIPFINLQNLINGFVFGGSFLGFYWMLAKFDHELIRGDAFQEFIRFTASNIYAISTFSIVTLWSNTLPVYLDIAIMPIILGLLFSSFHRFSLLNSVSAALVLTFSPAPYGSMPWLLPILICFLPIFFSYCLTNLRNAFLTTGSFFLSTCLLMFPAIILIFQLGGYSNEMVTSTSLSDGIRVYRELNRDNSLLMALGGTPPQSWSLSHLHIYKVAPKTIYIFSYIASFGLIFIAILNLWLAFRAHITRARALKTISVVISWLTASILYTGGGQYCVSLMIWLMKIFPILVMFRNNYDKYSIAISIFFSLFMYFGTLNIYRYFSKDIHRK